MIAFLDASALIYLIEGNEPFAERVRQELAAVAKEYPDLGAAASRLTWLEYRVGRMKANDSATFGAYDAFFARPDLAWVGLTRDVMELAATVRVKSGLRTPDALQAASCLQLGSDHLFLSGDKAFKRVGGLKVKLLTCA